MTDTRVRAYDAADRAACLALFDGNTPTFFAAGERSDFAGFLDAHAASWAFQVVERSGAIVACGGHRAAADGETAGFCWGMVDRAQHRTGLGRILTQARLDAARATPGVRQVRLDTSQHTQGFYARFGFVVERVVPDGYSPGLDRVDMLLRWPA
ncbi:putative GNAT family N-acyltransferase [Sphingomonas endophytica]|jgi:predicted GNAT family N-acyltransferase|uniref:Putative GNAT family N-acyltransferase n=1 Tax=Sphingomonas endophytica TaxID=869719 RepID=A0A7X0MRF7_9SPHN|nr:GNAT family N-acetyltransferase [Sphingomonas endophytica]MBB6506433.1 putative GNAT family N-acyltransferase [Sphingomonas endophytica]